MIQMNLTSFMLKPKDIRFLNKILPNRFKLYTEDSWEDLWGDLKVGIFYHRLYGYDRIRMKPISNQTTEYCVRSLNCWKAKNYNKLSSKIKRLYCWITRHEAYTMSGLGGIWHCVRCHIQY